MNYNYHTHTYFSHHAAGSPEEYILRAIENGIEFMGFSDHIPFKFPDGYESPHRITFRETADYIALINKLREKYKDKIEIKIGFEAEYYPLYFDKMLENAINFGAEYLILGQHYLYNEHQPRICSGTKTENATHLKEYVSNVLDAINSEVFTYIAHPDFMFFVGEEKLYCEEMRKICAASREKNIPLEINFLGIRDHRQYPSDLFWKIAGEEKSPVTFGFDAHTSFSSFDGESLLVANDLVKKYNLNYIGKPTIVNIQHCDKLK